MARPRPLASPMGLPTYASVIAVTRPSDVAAIRIPASQVMVHSTDVLDFSVMLIPNPFFGDLPGV